MTAQPSENYEHALDRAAELWGIHREYWDIWGHRHVTSADTKRGILKALGVACESREELDQAIAEYLRKKRSRLLPPCLVISENQSPKFCPVQGQPELTGLSAQIEIRREDGESERYAVTLSEQVPLPHALPLGYHDLEISVDGTRETMRLIVAPDRAYRAHGRAAGIAISLYGVRSGRNWGCGDFHDLYGIIDWVAEEIQGSFVALNPLHAIHNRKPFNSSPYLPNCVYYRNPLYLDVESIEDFRNSARAQHLWSSEPVRAELEALRVSEFVEYERVYALKLKFLKLCFLHFLRDSRNGCSRITQFHKFIAQEGELLDRYAIYSALDEFIHARNPEIWMWPDWPKCFHEPESPETLAFSKKHWRSVLFHKYLQWQVDLQLASAQRHARDKGLSIGLYHDLALATDRCGSDLWAHREFYVSGCRVGSPPDDFSPGGQDWAFPPPCSERHWESGYRLFIDSIRKNCRHGGALRIDHVMRFFRLYWIPDGSDATGGAYVGDRHEDLIRILALESVREKVVIVGEDLGTVEPAVRDALARFGILSYRLFYFERDERGQFRSFDQYPKQALVSATTHDLPTLAGFWVSADIEARRRCGLISVEGFLRQLGDRAREKQQILDTLFALGLLPESFPRSVGEVPDLTGELHNGIVGFLASTPSELLAVNQEDLTKELEQQNLPGTTWQYPNWSRKMKFTVEQLRSEKLAQDFTAMFRNWIAKTGRAEPRRYSLAGSADDRGSRPE